MTLRLRRSTPTAEPRRGRGDAIGLDLGATAVRAAVLVPSPGAGTSSARTGISARRLGSVPVPPGAIVQGVVQDLDAVAAALRRLAAEHRLRGRRVVLGVGTPQVVVRPLTLPDMPPDRLRQVLPFQARDILPFPVSEALLDFVRLPPADGTPPLGGNRVSGLLTATPRVPVMLAVQAMQRAGLAVHRVDLSPFGLLRSIGTPGPAVEALVDIGAELTTIVIHRHGVPHVVRVVAFGGRRLAARVADALGVAPAEAESTTCAVGAIGESVPALQVRDGLRALVSEVRASLRYFVTTVGSAVQRVLITGGTAALPGLDALLAHELGLPVLPAAPLRHLTGPSAPAGPASTAVSVGLALGRAA